MGNPQLNFMNGSSYTTITPVRVSSSTEDDYTVTISQNNTNNQPLQITVDDGEKNRNLFVASNSGYVGIFDLATQTWKMQVNDFDGLKSKGMVYRDSTLDSCYCSAQASSGQWLRIWCQSDVGNRGLVCTDSSISIWNIDESKSELNLSKLTAYPVGAIYISYVSTSPSTLFGGSWTALTAGRYLRMSGSTSTGGKSTHQHSLADSTKAMVNMSTSGNVYMKNQSGGIQWTTDKRVNNAGTYSTTATTVTDGAVVVGATESTDSTDLPLFQNVYAWRRTA